MDHCLNCGGAIGEPGVVYGYAGRWCFCIPPLQHQRPASKESGTRNVNLISIPEAGTTRELYIQELEKKNKALTLQVEQHKKDIERMSDQVEKCQRRLDMIRIILELDANPG